MSENMLNMNLQKL